MNNAIPYALSFTASTFATFFLAAPMPYVVASKAEYIEIEKAKIEQGQTVELPTRSYNNPLAYGFTGAMAIASFICLVGKVGDKPLIAPTQQPQQVQSQPVVINNNNVAAPKVVNRVSVGDNSTQKPYSADIAPPSSNYDWMNQLHEVNCLLIFGAQGTGKTTLVEHEVKCRQNLDHDIIVLDPHRKYGAWEGMDVVGDGRNYNAINEALLDIQQLIDNRYLQYSTVPDFNPKPITIICEEFTQWNYKCKNSDAFFSASLSDVRKIRIHVMYVAHGDTLVNLTKKTGMGRNRDLGMTKLELIGKQTETGKTVPSGKANLYLQGNPTPILVSIPDLSNPSTKENEEEDMDDLFNLDNVIPINRRAS